MFPNCIDHLGRRKTETKQQQAIKGNQGKYKQIKNGNNSIYHDSLSEEWIGRRSLILHQINF